MWRITLRGLLAHKLRFALTALAIEIGVTFVSGTLVLTDTLNSTFTGLFNKVYQHVDFEVRGTAAFTGNSATVVRHTMPESLLKAVRAVDGVSVADGGVDGYAQYVAKDGKAIVTGGAPTIGTSFFPDQQLSSLQLADGTAPTRANQVVMDEGTAKKYHFRVGDRVKILLPGPPQTFTISGIVRFGTSDNLAGATIAAFNLPTAQKLFFDTGRLDTIDVFVAPGANRAAVQRSIAAVLPHGVEVVTGQTVANEQTNSIKKALGFLSTALLVFAFIALFVGGFTIFNTFSIIVGQRTRELALLRIVGASRRQVFRSVLLEAFLLGLTASIIGLGLGVLTAIGLEKLLAAFSITLPHGSLVFASRTVIAGLLVGVGVTVVSAISPARRAVRIAPVEALTSVEGASRESSHRRVIGGLASGVAGIGVLSVGLTKPAIQLVGLGAVGIFIGVGMLSPLIARPLSSILGRPLVWLMGIAAKLGRENSMRSPRRTAQTASALLVGLALVSAIAVFGASISRSTTASVNEAVSADYIITAPIVGGVPTGFSDAAITAATHISGVSTVSVVHEGEFEFQHSITFLTAVTPKDLSRTTILRMDSGRGTRALTSGEMLIDTTTAHSDHLSVGSRVRIVFAKTGAMTIRIGGIFKPNALLGSYCVSNAFFSRNFSSATLPVGMLLRTDHGASRATTQALKRGLAAYPNLQIQTRSQFEKSRQAQVNTILGLVYVLMALAIVIALIGIVNALILSVFERTHEIGLLRAVGMKRRQVRAMIRAEAVILSLFGAVVGIVVGTGLGVALSDSLKQQGITDTVIPYSSLIVFLVLAGLLGLAAATWPARRAAKLNVLEAIATE